jgi:hypothetical protein
MKTDKSATRNRAPGPARIAELTLRIAERANRLAQERGMAPGRELDLWLEAEAEVKRELCRAARRRLT